MRRALVGGAAQTNPSLSPAVNGREEAVEHATVEDGDTVFRFDTGDVLIVERVTNLDVLRDALFII
jgi:hypothetical protein